MQNLLLILFLFIFLDSYGQITIESNECLVPVFPDSISGRRMATNIPFVPSIGNNQNWDYSTLSGGSSIYYRYSLPISDTNYSSATAMIVYNPSMGNLTLQNSREYYKQDANGFYSLGFRTDSNYYDLSSMGGSGSYLYFPVSYVKYNNYKELSFPFTMNDQWFVNENAVIPYRLNLTNFGIFNQQGEIREFIKDTFQVVGYGTLKYPGSVNSYNALLVNRSFSRIDSIYLNGAPANPLLLQQFGVSQGQETKYTYQYIYIENMGVPVISYFYDTNDTILTYVTMHPQSTSISSSSSLTALFIYPNPATNTIQFSENIALEIYDINGKLLYNSADIKANQPIDISSFPKGIYYYKAFLSNNQDFFSGSFIKP